VYTAAIVPGSFARVLAFNPLAPLVQASQQAILYRAAPDFAGLGWVAVLALVALAAAMLLFRRASPDMVDVL
jgi:lipopolysaccharide transport system permease protein